jgi:hypothetical protein
MWAGEPGVLLPRARGWRRSGRGTGGVWAQRWRRLGRSCPGQAAARRRARGWSCGASRPRVAEGPAWGSQLAAAAHGRAGRRRAGVRVRVRDWQRWSGAQGGGVQCMAVSPRGELRPRPGQCAGRLRAVREELQCGGCGWIRMGQWGRVWRASEAVEEKAADEVRRHCELLVENGGGLAWAVAEGAALMQADHGPRGGRGGGYSAASSEGEAAQRHEAIGRAEPRVGVAECRGAARHDELPPPMRRSRQEQCSAGSTRSARPAAVVGRP